MPSVYIVKRKTVPGKENRPVRTRYHVRYQRKRRLPTILLGVYDTEGRALIAKERALDELAAGREPNRAIRGAPEASTVAVAAQAWIATLEENLAPRTLKNYRRTVTELPAWLAKLDPLAMEHTHVQRFVDELKRTKARATIEREIVALRSILDYAGASPNPASDRRVRLPRKQRKVYRLPSQSDLAKLHTALPDRRELLIFLEHTGLRISEAAALTWADFDTTRNRFLVQDSKTTAGRRWVTHLEGTPPFPEQGAAKPTDAVFQPSPLSLTAAIWHAHKRGDVPLFSAHDLRHLAASRWLHEGTLSPAEIAERLGHSTPAISLNTYSHVVPPD